jgi:hypothetical protein
MCMAFSQAAVWPDRRSFPGDVAHRYGQGTPREAAASEAFMTNRSGWSSGRRRESQTGNDTESAPQKAARETGGNVPLPVRLLLVLTTPPTKTR